MTGAQAIGAAAILTASTISAFMVGVVYGYTAAEKIEQDIAEARLKMVMDNMDRFMEEAAQQAKAN